MVDEPEDPLPADLEAAQAQLLPQLATMQAPTPSQGQRDSWTVPRTRIAPLRASITACDNL